MERDKKCGASRRAAISGQILTEYVIMLAMFIGVALIMVMLLAVFTEYGWRIISLVGLEYP